MMSIVEFWREPNRQRAFDELVRELGVSGDERVTKMLMAGIAVIVEKGGHGEGAARMGVEFVDADIVGGGRP